MSFLAHVHGLEGLGTPGWIAVGIAALVALWSIWRCVQLTLEPGEDEPDHMKNIIFERSIQLRVSETDSRATSEGEV